MMSVIGPLLLAATGAGQAIPPTTIARLTQGQVDGLYLYDFRRYPADIQPQLVAIAAENMVCRGNSGDDPDTIAACDRREHMMKEVERKGWCFGPDEADEASKRWMRQGSTCHN